MEHESSILYEPVNALARRLGVPFSIPDHVIMALLVLLVSCIVFPLVSRRLSRERPSGFQQFLELIVAGLRGLLDDIVGHGAADRFLYIMGAFAAFIFMSNMCGLFYFLQPPTGNINTTFALSLTAFFYYNYQGIRAQGIVGYIKHFWAPPGAPWAIGFVYFPIEIISHTARMMSLSLRLFGNIFGEELVILVLFSIIPFLVPLPMMFLGLVTGALQAFIFMLLSIIYLQGAVAVEHHEDAHHGNEHEHDAPHGRQAPAAA